MLSVDFPLYTASLADEVGVDHKVFEAAVGLWARQVMDGRASIGSVLEEALAGWGQPADAARIDSLVSAERALLRELAVLHDDAVPFLESLRSQGVRTAFVSNCSDNTRPLLDALGLSPPWSTS